MRGSGEGNSVPDIVDFKNELNESFKADSKTPGWRGTALPQVQVPFQALKVKATFSDTKWRKKVIKIMK